jgi:SAM-dependent methyltransferase
MDQGYLLDNARPEATTRFGAISALFDRWTFAQIDALGIAPGWRCWEVGAGGANVPDWLAARVAPAGRVLATDIETVWAEGAISASVDVRRHDVAKDPPPWTDLDLAHARLVLVHVPDRERALDNMIASLRPGGWLLIEDADPALQPLACPDAHGPEQQLANKVRDGFRRLMKGRGVDLGYGRKLPRLLRDAGLIDVQAEAFFPVTHPASAVLERATVEMLRSQLCGASLVTEEEIERHLTNLGAGGLDLTTAPLITVRGRKAP